MRELRREMLQLIDAATEVRRELSCGFPAAIYREALQVELGRRGAPFLPSRDWRLAYKGEFVGREALGDLVCGHRLLVRVCVGRRLGDREEDEMRAFLRASGAPAGLLLNFGNPQGLEYKALFWSSSLQTRHLAEAPPS